MVWKTHRDFQSLVPSVKNANDIFHRISEAIICQFGFEKKTTPQQFQLQLWKNGEFDQFEIDVEKIDRLYHIANFYEGGNEHFELLCRIKGEDNIYVNMTAIYYYEGKQMRGEIYVDKNVKTFMQMLFMKKRLPKNIDIEKMAKSLENDNILNY